MTAELVVAVKQRIRIFQQKSRQSNTPPVELTLTSYTRLAGRAPMKFLSSKDESLLSLWESVRRQVLADRASGGRSRFVGENLRSYAESLRSEMDRRELKYTPIDWRERSGPRSAGRTANEDI
jgi:hypothetical protein